MTLMLTLQVNHFLKFFCFIQPSLLIKYIHFLERSSERNSNQNFAGEETELNLVYTDKTQVDLHLLKKTGNII